MNKTEATQILATLRAAYPAFYAKVSEMDSRTAVNLWAEMFAEYEYNLVSFAVSEIIKSHSGYPPDIATVIEKIESITAAANGEPTAEELFGILRKSVSYYDFQENFKALPPVLQRYCGSPERLREYAKMQSETFETVVHGQFLREIKTLQARMKADRDIPESIRVIADRMRMPELQPPKTEEKMREKAQNIVRLLDEAKESVDPAPSAVERRRLTIEEQDKRRAELLRKFAAGK